jgi:hypothetical protein
VTRTGRSTQPTHAGGQVTNPSATFVGSGETSRSGQARVGFGADDGSEHVPF